MNAAFVARMKRSGIRGFAPHPGFRLRLHPGYAIRFRSPSC